MSDRSWLRKTSGRAATGRETSIDTGSPVPHGIVVATCRVHRFIMTADSLDLRMSHGPPGRGGCGWGAAPPPPPLPPFWGGGGGGEVLTRSRREVVNSVRASFLF